MRAARIPATCVRVSRSPSSIQAPATVTNGYKLISVVTTDAFPPFSNAAKLVSAPRLASGSYAHKWLEFWPP